MALITPFACLEGKFDDIMSLGKFLFKWISIALTNHWVIRLVKCVAGRVHRTI